MARQNWDPETYAKNARFVSDLGADVVKLLGPQPGETILDLGCGDGALTESLVAAGCRVVGVDSSAEQVAAARKRGIDARVMDAETLPFDGVFDAVFSNAVLHWIRRAGAVLDSVRRALKPGGRFAAEFGGAGNVARIRSALAEALSRRGVDASRLDPWFYPTPDEYRALLEKHGFDVKTITRFERPTILPGHLSEWLRTFAQPFLKAVDLNERNRFIDDVCRIAEPHLFREGQGWAADYVRIRFLAVRANK